MIKRVIVYIFLIFITGCTTTSINKTSIKLNSSKLYVIGTFINYTQTPMAGLKVSSIIESLLNAKGIAVVSINKDLDRSNILSKEIIRAKKFKADYLLTGEVQEWRYKVGVDGEPVVSYSIKIIDLSNNKIVYSAVGSKSGLGYNSLGVVAQELAKELIPNFK